MFNCVQKSFTIIPLRFLGGVLPVHLMLANYSYVVLEGLFVFPIPYFYLCTSYVKNRIQKKQQQKKKRNKLNNSHFNQFSYLSPFAIEDILHPLDSFLTQLKRNFVSLRP